MPLVVASKRTKFLGINLTIEVKDIHWKLQNIAEKIKDTNGKTSHVRWLKDLILLRCPYYPNWFTDSIQSLAKS